MMDSHPPYTESTWRNGRLIRARFDPRIYNPLSWRARCRRCKAVPGGACVTPKGWGTKTHAVREADSHALVQAVLDGKETES